MTVKLRVFHTMALTLHKSVYSKSSSFMLRSGKLAEIRSTRQQNKHFILTHKTVRHKTA